MQHNYRLIVRINIIVKFYGYVLLEHMPNTTKPMQLKFKNMTIRPIKTKKDYQNTLKRLEVIFDAKPGMATGDELEVLSILIAKYEQEHFPIDLPDPIEAIKFRMEQLGYTQNDLANAIGLKSRASEILNKKRKLTLDMIRSLHEKLNIPTDVLIQSY